MEVGQPASNGEGQELYISSAGRHPGRIKLTKPVNSCGRLVFSKVRARIDVEGGETVRYGFPIYTCESALNGIGESRSCGFGV